MFEVERHSEYAEQRRTVAANRTTPSNVYEPLRPPRKRCNGIVATQRECEHEMRKRWDSLHERMAQEEPPREPSVNGTTTAQLSERNIQSDVEHVTDGPAPSPGRLVPPIFRRP